jgi:hypothetical protein
MWPMYVPLYNGKGSLISWVPLDHGGFTSATSWIRPRAEKAGLFSSGFTNQFYLSGAPYSPTGNIFGANQETCTLTDANGIWIAYEYCTISPTGGATVSADPVGLQLHVNRATGSFTGSFNAPDDWVSVPLKGVILQNQKQSWGYFMDANHYGSFLMQ